MGSLAFRHSLALTFFGRMSKVGPLPSGKVMLSLPSSVVWAPPTPLPGFPLHFSGVLLLETVTSASDRRPGGVSPVPEPAFLTFRSLYAGGFFGTALQSLRAFHGLRPALPARLPLGPLGSMMTTRQDSLDVADCQVAMTPL